MYLIGHNDNYHGHYVHTVCRSVNNLIMSVIFRSMNKSFITNRTSESDLAIGDDGEKMEQMQNSDPFSPKANASNGDQKEGAPLETMASMVTLEFQWRQ